MLNSKTLVIRCHGGPDARFVNHVREFVFRATIGVKKESKEHIVFKKDVDPPIVLCDAKVGRGTRV